MRANTARSVEITPSIPGQPRDRGIRPRRGPYEYGQGYFAILKRGITGTYHHVSQQHLKRYLGEFDFRYNDRAALKVTDAERVYRGGPKGVVGKRVTYQGNDRSGTKTAN